MQVDERSVCDNAIGVEDGVHRSKPLVVVVGCIDHGSVVFDALPSHLYQVSRVTSLERLLEYLRFFRCDIVLVEAHIEDSDSISVVRSLVASNYSPMLLVRLDTNDEIDRVLALELGADDCVAFTCGTREIRARVGALLRRHAIKGQTNRELVNISGTSNGSELTYNGWTVNKDRCQLYTPSGEAITLTNVEYGIVVVLFSDPGTIRDRSSLRNIDSGNQVHEFRSLDVCLSRLRKKMERHGGHDLIETVRGRGYRLAKITNSH